jgi:hypothetical protein
MNESRHIVSTEALTAKNRRSLRPSDLEAFGGNASRPRAILCQAEISGHADNAQLRRAQGPGLRALHSWSAAQDLAELDINFAAITQAGGWKSTRMPLQYGLPVHLMSIVPNWGFSSPYPCDFIGI